MNSSEKVAYLRGLMEGLDLEENDKYTKLFNAVIDTLDELASELSDMDEDICDISDYVGEIDSDLDDLEDYVYECDDDCCGGCCDCDDEDDFIEVECPACQEKICIDYDAIDENGQVECPNCGELLEFEIEDADDVEEDKD